MSQMKIDIQNSIPMPITEIVANRLEAVRPFFPNWCNKVVVGYSYSAEDVMTCDVQYEYRTIILTIHPPFLDDDDWFDSLIHEIGHGLLKPLTQFGDKVIEHYVEDEHTRKFLYDHFLYLEEQVTEDLAIFGDKLRQSTNKLKRTVARKKVE